MRNDSSPRRPLVSVILATFNEGRSIERCLSSILNQETPDFDLEILAVDGKSTDDTREILDRMTASEPRLRVLINEKRRTPFAFNLGLREARGEYVCIFGGHTFYRKDYISVCLRELKAHGAVGCGGRVVTCPANKSLQARLVAWAMSHPFGSSRKSFRTQPEGFVDTVNYPLMVKEAVLEAGGYDEELTRNQDNDLNQKMLARGNKLYCTWKTQCFYHPKGTLRDLLRYASRNGYWNVISLEKNFESMGVRHFIPCLFVLSLLGAALLACLGSWLGAPSLGVAALPLLMLLGLHLGAGAVAALQVAIRERSPDALLLPPVFLGFHTAYGLGTLAAFATHGRWLASLPGRWIASRRAADGNLPQPALRPSQVRWERERILPARVALQPASPRRRDE